MLGTTHNGKVPYGLLSKVSDDQAQLRSEVYVAATAYNGNLHFAIDRVVFAQLARIVLESCSYIANRAFSWFVCHSLYVKCPSPLTCR